MSRRRILKLSPWVWAVIGVALLLLMVIMPHSPKTDEREPVLPPAAQPPPEPPKPRPQDLVVPEPTAYTNEDQQKMLQKETEHLGIRVVEARGAGEEPTGSFMGKQLGTPASHAQAEAAVRELAAMRRAIDESSGRPPVVPIEGRTAPVLAEEPAGGGAIEAGAEDVWIGQYSGEIQGGRTVLDQASWKKLWGAVSRRAAPAIDFKTQEVVGIFLGRRPTGGYRVEIVSVVPSDSFLSVTYRETEPPTGPPPPDGETSPYALRAVPRTDLPVRYLKAP